MNLYVEIGTDGCTIMTSTWQEIVQHIRKKSVQYIIHSYVLIICSIYPYQNHQMCKSVQSVNNSMRLIKISYFF